MMMQQETLIGSEELDKFYKNDFYFSYSGLNKLLFSPQLFYSHYILNEREDSTDPHLVGGRVLHCLLLEPDKYNEYFISMPGKIPTESQRKIITNILTKHLNIENNSLDLNDYSNDILTELATANLYQSLKTDQSRLDKILTKENQEYFEFLKNKQDKTLVDEPTLQACKKQLEVLKRNDDVRSLLQLDKTEEDTHIETYTELHLKMEHPKLPFGLHGVIDSITIDKESKTLFINDLKTTGKSIQNFPEAIEYYKYWIQGAIYFLLAADKFLKDLPDAHEWKIKITFIVIDKYNLTYPFQVSEETMSKWNVDFVEIMDIAKWHYENKRYDLPYDLANGNFKL
jgi:hypothetical protein